MRTVTLHYKELYIISVCVCVNDTITCDSMFESQFEWEPSKVRRTEEGRKLLP